METASFSGWFQFESVDEATAAVQGFPQVAGYEQSLVKVADLNQDGDRVSIEVEREADEATWDLTVEAIIAFATPSIDGAFDTVHATEEGDMVITLTFDDDDDLDDGDDLDGGDDLNGDDREYEDADGSWHEDHDHAHDHTGHDDHPGHHHH